MDTDTTLTIDIDDVELRNELECATVIGNLLIGHKAGRGALARAQNWACAGCGKSLAGGTATLAMIGIPTKTNGIVSIPALLHDGCVEDGDMVPRLAKIPALAAEGLGADEAAAERARAGAVHFAFETALLLFRADGTLASAINRRRKATNGTPQGQPASAEHDDDHDVHTAA